MPGEPIGIVTFEDVMEELLQVRAGRVCGCRVQACCRLVLCGSLLHRHAHSWRAPLHHTHQFEIVDETDKFLDNEQKVPVSHSELNASLPEPLQVRHSCRHMAQYSVHRAVRVLGAHS